MNSFDERSREEIQKEIDQLPKGTVNKKKVHGRTYFYHRFYQDGKRRERIVSEETAEELRTQIQRRKELEHQLKERPAFFPESVLPEAKPAYHLNIFTGSDLRQIALPASKLKQRECIIRLEDYLYGEDNQKVFVLCGLRRTGKTTMIYQMISQMPEEMFKKTAFIQITAKDNMGDLNKDLHSLRKAGYKYVFLDEVTLLEDFIEGSALFSDVFAMFGMKIILSGTDSLGFVFTQDEQLYDRCFLLHTTFIPYRDFERTTGIVGIDEFIRFGGTMSLSGTHYHADYVFSNKKTADRYVDSAIARNIQNSLRYYQDGGHFRDLADLYEKNELTSAINRIIEDQNHYFTLEVLTRKFTSHDLKLSARNLRRDIQAPSTILDDIDRESVTKRLKEMLEIRDKEEQRVPLDEVCVTEINEYLHLLDLVEDIPVVNMVNLKKHRVRTIIAQPGLRYAQAKALIESLVQDPEFESLSEAERKLVENRILDEIKGRMMEDIILLETKYAFPEKKIFVLQFQVGEYDMVVYDRENGCCQIYEIKHSMKIIDKQTQHLRNEQLLLQTEHRYGPITGRYVIYRGEDAEVDGITYLNVEGYLRNLAEPEQKLERFLAE